VSLLGDVMDPDELLICQATRTVYVPAALEADLRNACGRGSCADIMGAVGSYTVVIVHPSPTAKSPRWYVRLWRWGRRSR